MGMPRSLTHRLPLLALLACLLTAGPAWADPWTDAFERICSFTDSATELPPEQLAALIAESAALLAAVPVTSDPQQKIRVFRLQKCHNLFRYLLDLHEATGADSCRGAPCV